MVFESRFSSQSFFSLNIGTILHCIRDPKADRAISDQICDERTKFDILCAFVNVSLCLTHRKHSIQRALNSPGSGEPFKYVERAWKVHKKFFRAIQSQKLHPKHDNSHIKL